MEFLFFCPKGCLEKPGYKQQLTMLKDEDGVPQIQRCPQCGFEHLLSFKEKILTIIYNAKWYFNNCENCEVDDYYIEDEDEDRVIGLLVKVVKGR